MRTLWLSIVSMLLAATAASGQTYKVLYEFGSHAGDPANPGGAIVQGRDGSLYGTSDVFDNTSEMDAFKMTPFLGKLTTLASVSEAGGQVVPLAGGLTLGTDGNYYGAAPDGGTHSAGTIFKVTPAGNLTTLYEFAGGADGAYPAAQPIQGIDGNFYGTTYAGGSSTNCSSPGCGTVYQVSPSGTHTVLHNFDFTDGQFPLAPLMQVTDGNFYGTANIGGSNDRGTIFKIAASGKFEVIYNFDGPHGEYPEQAALIQGSDGNLYGTTPQGGLGAGLVFKIVHGIITPLYEFLGESDGNTPNGLIQATDGNFYGTTSTNTIFRVSPSGSFSTLYTLPPDGSGGDFPEATLLQHSSGSLYGTTIYGGSGSDGGLFSFGVGLAPFVTFLPAARQIGHTVEILGQGFNGATGVSFNGTPATTFTVYADTYLTATVPNGATTGFIKVATSGGTLTSDKQFHVKPQITSFSPTSGPPGTSVVVTGMSLSQTSKITFNSVVATSFTVNSDTHVTVTVPAGATTTKIGLTTTGAPVYSATAFTVTQ